MAIEVYPTVVANHTTSASTTGPATTSKATTPDAWKKPEAHMNNEDRIISFTP